MSIFQFKINTDVVAWYGAIVATSGLFLSGYNIFRDKAKVVVSYQKGMRFLNALSPYSENKDYFIITATNKGRRPVAIGNVAIKYFSGETFILADSVSNQNERVITEEKPETKVVTDQSEIYFSKLYYIQVFDRAGREYRKYLGRFPTFKKFWYLIKNYAKK